MKPGNGSRRVGPVAMLAAGAVLAAAGLVGCKGFFKAVNGGGGGTGTTTNIYVTNVGSGGTTGTLTCYSLTSGVLAPLTGSPITLPAAPTSIAVAPNNNFLFVGTQLGVFLYTRASNGTLTEGNNDTVLYVGPSYPRSLAVDASSSWLIVANNGSTELDALAINPTTGVATSNTPYTVALTAASPAQIALTPANNSVAVALGAGGVDLWAFNAASKTTPWGTTRNGINLLNGSTSANAVAYDTSSTYLFVAESTGSTTADKLRKLTLSTLSSEVDYPTGKGPSSILPDLSGDYVYVANQTDNTITGFALSAGALTALGDSPFGTAKTPLALVEDSTKSYVLTAGYGNNPNLWLYSFDTVTPGTLDVKTTTSTGSVDPSLSNAIAATH